MTHVNAFKADLSNALDKVHAALGDVADAVDRLQAKYEGTDEAPENSDVEAMTPVKDDPKDTRPTKSKESK